VYVARFHMLGEIKHLTIGKGEYLSVVGLLVNSTQIQVLGKGQMCQSIRMAILFLASWHRNKLAHSVMSSIVMLKYLQVYNSYSMNV